MDIDNYMTMKNKILYKNKIIYIGFALSLLGTIALTFSACDDKIDPLVEELNFDRLLGTAGFTAQVQNLTTIRVNWELRDGASHYVLELHEDNLEFNHLVYTSEVMPNQLPNYQFTVALAGETVYSARVMAVSATELGDSKWAVATVLTPAENIFLDIQDGDINFTETTLRWSAGSEVTHITLNPGNIQHTITGDEKTAGVATVTGLNTNTEYIARLYNDTKSRGLKIFTTLTADGTVLSPGDDLAEAITVANPGDVLLLTPGDYTVNVGETIVLNKSISIKGLYPYDKPKLHVAFNLQSGATDVELVDLDLNGTGTTTLDRPFNLGTAGVAYGSVKISGCNIHDFGPQLIYGNVAATLDLFSVDNSIITNFSGGGDFIDFRLAYVKEVKLTNSTFNNCSPARDFVRLDAAGGYSGGSLTSTVLIDHCTFYGVSAGGSNRILYVRFVSNVLTVQNSLFASANGIYSNQAATSQPTCANNNYFEAPGYFTVAGSNKIDVSGTHTTLNPGFANAAAGDFTISNQTLLDNEVGDPRWRQ